VKKWALKLVIRKSMNKTITHYITGTSLGSRV